MRRILVVRTDRVGDVIMITSMVRELRKTFPDAFIGTMTTPENSDIFLHNPHVDVALTDDLRKGTFWTVMKELRQHKFTDGLLVLPTERAAYQMFFAGIRNRVGVGYKLYGVLTFMKGVSRKKYVPLRHESDYCMDLARRIGVVTDNIKPEIFLTEDERMQTAELFRTRGIAETDTKIIVHTGAGGSSPNWSERKYLQLVRTILREFDDSQTKIVLTAKEMSAEFRRDALALAPSRIVDVSVNINRLRDLIKIVGVSDVVMTSSTGPAHIADALNVGVVVIYCHRPMNCTKLWGLLNPRSINLEVSDEYCRTHCSHDQNACAFEDGISINEVISHICILLDRQQQHVPTPARVSS